jgi:hypothetical protein
VTFAPTAEARESRTGLRILPDQMTAGFRDALRLPDIGREPPAAALDRALQAIAARYGEATADFVAVQLEYPRAAAT